MIKSCDYEEALGQAIRERREQLEISPEKFARIVGKDTAYITSVEDGEAKLNLHQMLVIARVLNMRLSVLFAVVEFRLLDG